MLPIQSLVRSQPLQRYTFQMLQASLRGSTFPQTSYSTQRLAAKEAEWKQTTARFAAELYQEADSLGTTAALLLQKNQTSLLNQRKAISSDAAKVSAQAMKGALDTSHPVEVEVASLAKAQVNQSLALVAQEKSNVQTGMNQFTLTVGGKSHLISVIASASDSNAQSLNRIAKAINTERAGVKASVRTDSRTGTAQLILTTNKPGTDRSFSLADVIGNAIAATDLNHTTAAAEDARYKLDGESFTAGSNTVAIDGGKIELTFSQTTESPVSVSISSDRDAIVKQTRELLDAYNRFHDKLESRAAAFPFDLTQTWDRLTRSIQPQLSQIGIIRNQDGTFALNEDALLTAMKDRYQTVEQMVGQENGLAAIIKKQADRLRETPLVALTQPSTFADTTNPYTAYSFSALFLQQAANTGLFYNQAF
ncbi:flagellar filament capping protein FliD [Brevibacillus fluminis]|uniref:flagellar filament capping protein FliD n=1 Tax=Brevibacillus fluminis TaxID=511487 RepID=UPI003F8A9444